MGYKADSQQGSPTSQCRCSCPNPHWPPSCSSPKDIVAHIKREKLSRSCWPWGHCRLTYTVMHTCMARALRLWIRSQGPQRCDDLCCDGQHAKCRSQSFTLLRMLKVSCVPSGPHATYFTLLLMWKVLWVQLWLCATSADVGPDLLQLVHRPTQLSMHYPSWINSRTEVPAAGRWGKCVVRIIRRKHEANEGQKLGLKWLQKYRWDLLLWWLGYAHLNKHLQDKTAIRCEFSIHSWRSVEPENGNDRKVPEDLHM